MVYRLLVGSISNYDSWANYLVNNRPPPNFRKGDSLLVDFSCTWFLEPFHLVSLACLIEEYYLQGARVSFESGGFALQKYLTNIEFYNYWEPGFDRHTFTHTMINTTLCLWKVSSGLIDSYANQAREYFERNFFFGKDLEALSITLKEVFNNIYDHSNSPVEGYVLTQYYPNKKEIVTSICDFGLGIPTKLNEMWVESKGVKLSDTQALRAAFMRKVSSKSTPRNRGMGLSYLLTNVRVLRGSLRVFSNNAFLLHDMSNELHIYKSNQCFPGTLININLKTENLPQMEEEIEDQEFYF